MPSKHDSHKGMALLENVKWVAENAYGVPASRVLLKDGFLDSLGAADDLCKRRHVAGRSGAGRRQVPGHDDRQ